MGDDEDAQRYVHELELAYDRRLTTTIIDGSNLAAELEAFLREQRPDDDSG
jgi:hypothetical protein